MTLEASRRKTLFIVMGATTFRVETKKKCINTKVGREHKCISNIKLYMLEKKL